MKIELNAQQKKDQATFRFFVSEEIVPHAERYDQEERVPSEVIAKLAQRGYLGATLPEEYGGRGMDMITYGLLNEELGRGCSASGRINMPFLIRNKHGSKSRHIGTEIQAFPNKAGAA